MSTSTSQHPNQGTTKTEPVYYLGELLENMEARHGGDFEDNVGGVYVSVRGCDEVEAGSNPQHLEGDGLLPGYLLVRIETARDAAEQHFSDLVQRIIIDGLRDYAAKHPTPMEWA